MHAAHRRSRRPDLDCSRCRCRSKNRSRLRRSPATPHAHRLDPCMDDEPARASDPHTETVSRRCLTFERALRLDARGRAPRRKDAGPCDRNVRDVATPCRAGRVTVTTTALPLPPARRSQGDRRDRRGRCARDRGDAVKAGARRERAMPAISLGFATNSATGSSQASSSPPANPRSNSATACSPRPSRLSGPDIPARNRAAR